jgi:predicted HicB family RNase H-like nuclease
MKDYFEYKGYMGSAEVDIDGNALVGKLLFLRDVITYSATSPAGLEIAFREAVDDYLQTCAELGDEPDIPCKGTFNVRIGPDLHREVALIARGKGLGLNEFVREALNAAVQGPAPQLIEHIHKHEHQHNVMVRTQKKTARIATTTGPATWETQAYAIHH